MRVSERGQGLSEGGDLVILSGSGVFWILNGNVVAFFGRKFPFRVLLGCDIKPKKARNAGKVPN